MTASIKGWYLAMTRSAPSLIVVVEEAGDLAQRFGDLARAEEVIFAPRNTELFFHVAGDIVHRAVAVQNVELRLRRILEFGQRTVARPLRDHAEAHFLEQDARRPGVAANVVIADDRHVIRRGLEQGGPVGSSLSNTKSRTASLAM